MIEQRLYQYPGCSGFVRRWFIVGHAVPFRTQAEALEAANRRSS